MVNIHSATAYRQKRERHFRCYGVYTYLEGGFRGGGSRTNPEGVVYGAELRMGRRAGQRPRFCDQSRESWPRGSIPDYPSAYPQANKSWRKEW